MHIHPNTLAPYLLQRGLLAPGPVAAGHLRVIETSSRHRNFQVRSSVGGLFVKQARPHDAMALATLRREGRCYDLAAHDPDFEAIAELVPRFVDFDSQHQLLITDLVAGAETLSQRFQRQRALDENITRRLGEWVGTFHRELPSDGIADRFQTLFPGQIPQMLWLDQLQPADFHRFGLAVVRLLDQARRDPVLVAASRGLRAEWHCDRLIHGDLKWDNVLVSPDDEGRDRLTLIDWELADRGDALWDVAGLLHSHLVAWLGSMPLATGSSDGPRVAPSAAPIEAQRPAIRQLWRGYVEARGFDDGDAEDALGKTLRLTGARLLQATFECTVAAGAMDGHPLRLLRAARHLFKRPEDARRHLGLNGVHGIEVAS